MDINKLTNHTNGQIDGTHAAGSSSKTVDASSYNTKEDISDKVSLNKYGFRNNEELYGKVELEKLNQQSFGRLKEMKAKLTEYENAKNISEEAVQKTEIGKMLNDPEVWSDIAQKMLK